MYTKRVPFLETLCSSASSLDYLVLILGVHEVLLSSLSIINIARNWG